MLWCSGLTWEGMRVRLPTCSGIFCGRGLLPRQCKPDMMLTQLASACWGQSARAWSEDRPLSSTTTPPAANSNCREEWILRC